MHSLTRAHTLITSRILYQQSTGLCAGAKYDAAGRKKLRGVCAALSQLKFLSIPDLAAFDEQSVAVLGNQLPVTIDQISIDSTEVVLAPTLVQALKQCLNLSILRWWHFSASARLIAEVTSQLTKLVYVDLSYCDALNDTDGVELVDALQGGSVTHLVLDGCRGLGEGTGMRLAQFDKLKQLSLQYCDRIFTGDPH